MRTSTFQRPSMVILIVALILTLAAQHATATTVSARTDETTKPTIFIHGFGGSDCEGDWGFLMDHMRANGWTGGFSSCRSSWRVTRQSATHARAWRWAA